LQYFTWTLTVFSLIGVVMNIRKHRGCFYIWGVTNASWAVVDWQKGLTAQAALFGIYFVLAIWGIWEWKRS
jgi:nicotinamide riboside transporter PnuC